MVENETQSYGSSFCFHLRKSLTKSYMMGSIPIRIHTMISLKIINRSCFYQEVFIAMLLV